MVTGGFSEKKTPKIWGSFAQNFVYSHFQQPKEMHKACSYT